MCKKSVMEALFCKSRKLHAAAFLWPHSEKGAGDGDNAFPEVEARATLYFIFP